MKYIATASTIALSVLFSAAPAMARAIAPIETAQLIQLETNVGLSRAKNLARQAAEQENGGLGEYRAEPSMHGEVSAAPYVENPDGSWTFTFRGYDPRSLETSGTIEYVYESIVTVTPTGEVTINYNGPIRPIL